MEKREFTEQKKIDEITRLRKEGNGTSFIAAQLGLKKTEVDHIVKSHNIPLGEKPLKTIDSATVQKIIMMKKQEHGNSVIAARTKTTIAIVKRVLTENGIATRSSNNQKKRFPN